MKQQDSFGTLCSKSTIVKFFIFNDEPLP